MSRVWFIGLWLGGAIVWGYLYLGMGKDAREREALQPLITTARTAIENEDYDTAIDAYTEAAVKLPDTYKREKLELMLRAAKAQAVNGDLVPAINSMNDTLASVPLAMRNDPVARDIRETLARNQYYTAWIMRLEGAPRTKWIVPADLARQHYRMLTEQAAAQPAGEPGTFAQNLEAVVTLTRMDLPTLKSLPLPPEARRGRQKGVGEGQKQGQPKPGEGEGKKKPSKKGPPTDARGKQPGAGRRPESFGS